MSHYNHVNSRLKNTSLVITQRTTFTQDTFSILRFSVAASTAAAGLLQVRQVLSQWQTWLTSFVFATVQVHLHSLGG